MSPFCDTAFIPSGFKQPPLAASCVLSHYKIDAIRVFTTQRKEEGAGALTLLPCGKRDGIAMIGLLIADRSWLIRRRTRVTLIAK